MIKWIYISAICALGLLCCYLFYSNMRLREQLVDEMLTKGSVEAFENDFEDSENNEDDEYVTFYICGEVNNPDVYTLPKGSRIIDAINEAGGSTDFASLEKMESVAGIITDGQKIYVPNIEDDIDKINYMNNNIISTLTRETTAKDPNVLVNINTADVDELCQIPGIGPATAQLIYDYRVENGEFTVIEDIMNVPRIGDKTFESIKKNITVD